MNKKLIIIGLILVLVVVVVLVKNGQGTKEEGVGVKAEVSDPLDTVSPFYNSWLSAVASTTTDPYAAGLHADSRLADSVKDYLLSASTTPNGLDPVLCQADIPPRVGGKLVYRLEDKAQYMMLSRGTGTPNPRRALVDLEVVNGTWLITKIACSEGEVAPEREFSFEREGSLLKHNAPPLNPNTWYLVFAEDGQDGHLAPLSFGPDSVCVSPRGETATCNPDAFVNPSRAAVKGEMTESGVSVKRVEFLE